MLLVHLALLAFALAHAKAQDHFAAFNCHAAHDKAELCHRAAFQGCVWSEASHQCNRKQLCSDHLTSGACSLDWTCRWWSGQCRPVIPGDITTETTDTLCGGLNYNTDLSYYDRMRSCSTHPQCEWDSVGLQCKADRNFYAFSASVTEGRCLQDGNAVWHRPIDSRCYDPLHPGMHQQQGHADHVICPPGVCYPRGRCDLSIVCSATTSAACNDKIGNCRWDTASGRCKAEISTQTPLPLHRWCRDAIDYSRLLTNLRVDDIGPRVCPSQTPGIGLANCTIRSDCRRKPKADVCSYVSTDNSCRPIPELICSEIRCPSVCVNGQTPCEWSADKQQCMLRTSTPDDGKTQASTGIPADAAASTGSDGDGHEGDTTDGTGVTSISQLGFLNWHFERTTGEIHGDVYVPLHWHCPDLHSPVFAIGNSTESIDAASWNCTSVSRQPLFPTVLRPAYIPCGEPYRQYFDIQLQRYHDFQLVNQTVYQPLNHWGIVKAVDVIEGETDSSDDDLLRYQLQLNLHRHTLTDTCVSDVSALVNRSHISVGPASVIEFLVPLSYKSTNRIGQSSSVDLQVHTLLYHNNDTVQYIEPAQKDLKKSNSLSRDPTVHFSLMQIGFAKTASSASSCADADMKAIQIVYALEVHNIAPGTTVGPRFLDDIEVASPCHGMYIFQVVPVGYGDNGATALFYLVLHSECRSATHGNLTWSHCDAFAADADKPTAGSIEVDMHVQLWQCLGNIPLDEFVRPFENDGDLCAPQTTRYAHASVHVGPATIWTTGTRRFDVNVALLRSPTSPTTDILLELGKYDGTQLPVPARTVLSDTSFNLAVFFDNSIVRRTVGLSIIPETVAVIGVDSSGRDLQPALNIHHLQPSMTVLPKQLLPHGSTSAQLGLQACKYTPGCDGFIVPTRLLKRYVPDAAYYRVALSCALSTGGNSSTTFNVSSSSSPSDAPETAAILQVSPTGRRLLQVSSSSTGLVSSSSSTGSTISSSSSSTGTNSASSSSSAGDNSTSTGNDTVIIIIEEIVIVETAIVVDLSALDDNERKLRAADALLIVFYVLLGLLLISVCIFAGYCWWGRYPDNVSAPFVLKSAPPGSNNNGPGSQVSFLQFVGAQATLPTLKPRTPQRRTGQGMYSRLPTSEA